MDNSSRNILISCGVIALVACLCLSLSSIGGAGWLLWERGAAPLNGLEITVTPSPQEATASVELTPEATADPPRAGLPEDVSRQMDVIEEQVVGLRGLQSAGQVARALLTPEQLHERVVNDFFGDYTAEEAQDDVRVLSVIGLIDPGFDLTNFYLDLYSEQIAGFYDDDTQEMYVIQGEGFKGPERLTYAHEYVHALQDQTYDLEEGLNFNDESCEIDTERCAAIQALIEGDASLAETQWLTEYATRQDYTDIQNFYSDYKSPVFDSAPAFMHEDFLFPYLQGQEFVEALYDRGGWEAVDAAYRDLPVSTEQILHPDQYPNDKPAPVELPDLIGALGAGWRELDRNVMGEWYTFLILAHGRDEKFRIDEAQARSATEGWGGDAYLVYYNETSQATVLVMRTVWETTGDANQFSRAFEEYAAGRFGKPGVDDTGRMIWQTADEAVDFRTADTATTWIIAPDTATAQAIWELLP